jgi:hypothetical protein
LNKFHGCEYTPTVIDPVSISRVASVINGRGKVKDKLEEA